MKSRNIFWGFLFILIAALIILNQLNILVGFSIVSLIITILLIPTIFTSLRHLNFWGVLFPLAVIGILYDNQLGITAFTPWPILGVALFLSIGLSILIPRRRHYHKNHKAGYENVTVEHLDNGVVDIHANFTGSVKYIDSVNLKRVNISCSCAGSKIYFDHAQISGEEAIINIEASCSGIELYIPKSWKLEEQITCILGGIDETGRPEITKDSKKVILTGRTSLSGIEITYI